MGRPAKSDHRQSVQERIENEFWKLLSKKALHQISVSELIKNAGCNRTTFYYHYADINGLAEKIIQRALPDTLPQLSMAYLSGEIEGIHIHAQLENNISRLGMLIGKDGSSRIRSLVEKGLEDMWMTQFHLHSSGISNDAKLLLQFLSSGITGIISRYGYPLNHEALIESMALINKLYAEKTLEFLIS